MNVRQPKLALGWNPLTTGIRSFLTSSTARCIFMVALFSVSSTVIRTCSSSFRCSQFGFPRFSSSCNQTSTSIIRPTNLKPVVRARMLCSLPHLEESLPHPLPVWKTSTARVSWLARVYSHWIWFQQSAKLLCSLYNFVQHIKTPSSVQVTQLC